MLVKKCSRSEYHTQLAKYELSWTILDHTAELSNSLLLHRTALAGGEGVGREIISQALGDGMRTPDLHAPALDVILGCPLVRRLFFAADLCPGRAWKGMREPAPTPGRSSSDRRSMSRRA